MPELPEVETVRRTLTPLLQDKTIHAVAALQPQVIAHPAPPQFSAALTGRTIVELGRRGKYLLFHLDDGALLVAHLRMTGRFLCTPRDYPRPPHTHVIFSLPDDAELRFADTRRFGRLWLLRPGEQDTFTGMQNLGPEPFDAACDAAYYRKTLQKRRINIKQALLDQHVVAGLGNIYVDEALFAARIAPFRAVAEIKPREWRRLAQVIPQILQQAIDNNGTTFRDYLDGEGREGQNMPNLQAYGRAGQACLACGELMERMIIGGRGTCYCPRCQK